MEEKNQNCGEWKISNNGIVKKKGLGEMDCNYSWVNDVLTKVLFFKRAL